MQGGQKGSKNGKNDIESIDDMTGFLIDGEQYIPNHGLNSDDEMDRGSGSDIEENEAENKRNQHANDMFYKNSGIQSQDALNLSKSKSDEKNGKGPTRDSNGHFGSK